MISDVLVNAVEEIERYRTDPRFAGNYEGFADVLDCLVGHINAVRRKLDGPPRHDFPGDEGLPRA